MKPEEQKDQQWGMLKMIKILLVISMVEITMLIIFQLPIFEDNDILRGFGFKKVWDPPILDEGHDYPFTYEGMVRASRGPRQNEYKFIQANFITIAITCLMIVLITLQREIYNSTGYTKFVTQFDGSMDLLVSLSELKKKSMAYI